MDKFFSRLNAAGLFGLSFFRHEYRIVKIAHIGSRTRSEGQFLYAKVQFILVPPPLSASAPSLRLLWQRHCSSQWGWQATESGYSPVWAT